MVIVTVLISIVFVISLHFGLVWLDEYMHSRNKFK